MCLHGLVLCVPTAPKPPCPQVYIAPLLIRAAEWSPPRATLVTPPSAAAAASSSSARCGMNAHSSSPWGWGYSTVYHPDFDQLLRDAAR
eukprot:1188321-Prorocentrum_minimum.AAC.1